MRCLHCQRKPSLHRWLSRKDGMTPCCTAFPWTPAILAYDSLPALRLLAAASRNIRELCTLQATSVRLESSFNQCGKASKQLKAMQRLQLWHYAMLSDACKCLVFCHPRRSGPSRMRGRVPRPSVWRLDDTVNTYIANDPIRSQLSKPSRASAPKPTGTGS